MPSKFDKIPINNEKHDKRVKLTSEDKEKIVAEYETGLISINSLAKKYGVSKRLIQFTLFPERKEKAQQLFSERQKDGRYYDKEKHNEYMKNHRDHKKELYNKGLLNESEGEN
jgi:transposase-like protein